MGNAADRVIVLGASAGGVEALTVFVSHLPADLAAAVLVVLHIPASAQSSLDQILARACALPVGVAVDGEPVEAGRVYVASADRHLLISEGRIRLTRGPTECRARPSIDVLFRSAALEFGPRAIGVVLTGTLDDGTAGLWAIKDRGGLAAVQDPASAAYGAMPASALRHVEADVVLPSEDLAREVVRMANEPVERADAPAPPSRMEVEALIAREGNGLQAGVMKIGNMSQYTCPDCHGVMVQIEEGSIVRFRCHTGHAFSIETLLSEVGVAIDGGLWDTIRAVEERILLLRQMAAIATRDGRPEEAAAAEAKADASERRLAPLRDLVLDSDIAGLVNGV